MLIEQGAGEEVVIMLVTKFETREDALALSDGLPSWRLYGTGARSGAQRAGSSDCRDRVPSTPTTDLDTFAFCTSRAMSPCSVSPKKSISLDTTGYTERALPPLVDTTGSASGLRRLEEGMRRIQVHSVRDSRRPG